MGGEALTHVPRDLVDCPVRLLQQLCGLTGRLVLAPGHLIARTPETRQEAVDAGDAVVVPVAALGRVADVEDVTACGVGPVLGDDGRGAHHIALVLRHLGPAEGDHSLGEEAAEWLADLE